MTINESFQSVSVTVAAFAVSRVERPATAPAQSASTPAAPATAPPQPTDTVALSGASRRGSALMTAVDADRDGVVSKDEFTSGAMALLRRAGGRHHAHRLERKLEKLFARVDGNHDGSIDANELTSALSRSAKRRGECHPSETCRPAESRGASAPVAASVTVVAVAIQQYTAVSRTTSPESSRVAATA